MILQINRTDRYPGSEDTNEKTVCCMYDSRPFPFCGGCSNDQIDDHIISLQDKISDVTASDSTEQEDQEPSTEERVYIDELTGTLLDFDGTHLTISSNGETYVFDVSQTRLECKYGVVSCDQVSVIYQGQLSGTVSDLPGTCL